MQNEQRFKLSDKNEEMTGYYYNMLMSTLKISVSKHLMDEYFTVIWANDYFYERTLYTKEEYEAIYQNRCKDYFQQDPEEYKKFEAAIAKAVQEGKQGYESICKMPQKGGGYIWIKITGTFSDERIDGIPVIYSVFTDVTEAVEQRELQKELEERTRELSAALDMAEAASREKSNFLSRMSHDIRTPMNAIIGMTDIASAHLDNPEKMKDCLRKISLSSQHLLGLINDVLDMSKIESGKMTLSESEMSLPEVMENIVAIMQTGIKEKRQRFDVRLRNIEHEQFHCDSLRLRQVLINILSNASKFTPEGGRILMAVEECLPDEEEGRSSYAARERLPNGAGKRPSDGPDTAWIRFTISDTGIGIRSEFMEHLFDAFTREQDSRVDRTEGSGLGLAISKKIVELMGGVIEAVSRPGEGTVFTVCLPLRICTDMPDGGKLPELKILVVDDDQAVCEYTSQLLREMGITAEWEDSGVKAVQRVVKAHLDKTDYDAAILDWKMPDQDGIETVRRIRNEVGRELPILIISAYDWSDIEEEALEAGVDGFLIKPLFASTLRRGVQKYVLMQDPSEKERAKRTVDFTGKRFLLVEDNELNREIAIELLRSAGAKMEYACDGARGVDKFLQSPAGYYDLILMDIQMPVMNGYDATRKIRSSGHTDALTVPILAMTADAFAEDVLEAKRAGMNSHLAKPLEMYTLIREIGKFL